jgi:AcrR family transcriptional regulator
MVNSPVTAKPAPRLLKRSHIAATQSRSDAKRAQIVEAAMRHFAEHGYHKTRVEDIAAELGISKGSVFQHFGSKGGLFLESYKRAVRSFPAYLDAPAEVVAKGFFAILRHWLEYTERFLHEDWVAYRVGHLGNYQSDLNLRREINRFVVTEDPYGTVAFVRQGIERGEVRSDLDPEMIISILDWTVERFQDTLLAEELDPGLFRRHGDLASKKEERIRQFLEVLRGAIGTQVPAPQRSSTAKSKLRLAGPRMKLAELMSE